MQLKISPIQEHALPLHFAIYNKMTTEVRCLVEFGADVNVRDKYKRTPLMLCCLENDEEWSSSVFTMLLQAGANVALSDKNGRNALMLAVIFMRKRIVDLLLSAIDYNISVRDNTGRSASHYAYLRGDATIITKINSTARDGTFYSNTATLSKNKKFPVAHKTQIRSLRYISVPEPCKLIIQQERTTARIHKSSTVMNVHQFRRGTMRRYLTRSARSVRSSSCDSFSISSGRCSSARVSCLQSQSPVLSRPASKQSITRESVSALNKNFNFAVPSTSSSSYSRSWKESFPGFWQILTEQSCFSYRVSASPAHQTFPEALGFASKDEKSDENGFLLEEEQLLQDENGAPRRSSMPLPKSSSSPQPVYLSRQRRRSEAAVGLTSTAFSKFFANDPKIGNASKSPKENKQAKKDTSDFLVEEHEAKLNKATTPADSNSSAKSLSSLERTDFATGKRLESSKVTATRHRSGSVPLPKTITPRSDKQVRSNSMPAIGDKNEKPPEKERLLVQTAVLEKEESISDVERSHDGKESVMMDAEDLTLDLDEEPLVTPRRRRRDSSLLPDRILPDITEENETLVIKSTQDNLKEGAKFTKNKTLRCKSAVVRGQVANGRRYR